ncbi:hypothetical protein DOTSEDRAFT_45957 [Dothistroma septosporum NZE10]|uniref:Uncharacterized protein n=1 Tax=Dothistroma septosporum (strain NZE10 / CBS 128990) TaxID=675120 RepID=N1PJW8_DOTSN|nr:hypothetical protein DOTSEDRAFT_45957 [Dothistroma septosporum NZE10]
MTSYQDDDTQSLISTVSVPLPSAPPPTGPNTVVGVELPTADEIGRLLIFSDTFRIARGTPATSAVATQDVPKPPVTEAEERGGVPENTVWPEVVDEKIVDGMKRLAQYANDMHALDPSKSVEQYYGERLAKLLREGEVKFNMEFLK